MAFAQGSRTQLTLLQETSFGVSPVITPGDTTIVPFNTHSLNLEKDRLQSQEIRSDRNVNVDRQGNRRALGDIAVEMRPDDYDILLETAFFSTFAGGVIEVGTTPNFIAMEDGALDISQYRLFSGCAASVLSVSSQVNQMINTTFSMVGQNEVSSATPRDSAPTAATGGEPFDSYTGGILYDGGAVANITGFDWSLTNSLEPTFVLGSAFTPQLEFGLAQIEGTLTAYWEDDTYLNAFLNEEEVSLSITYDGPNTATTYTFFMPRVKVNGAAVPVSDPQSRIITCPIVALYDSVEGTSLRLTKA